jgi:Cdc6-like AAA superfamily ATPase
MKDIHEVKDAMDCRENAMRSEAEKRLQIIDDNLDLIISSYKYRLVELCKALEQQGFMYQYQYDHLSEFYHLYRKLGGNGQAQEYFERVCDELKTRPNPDGYHVM